jgi:transposase
MSLSKEELFRRIRSDSVREGLSIRALARRHRVGRRLVRQALTSSAPTPRKTPVRNAPSLGPFREVIDGWLRENLAAPVKQRQTVRRMADRLVEEYGSTASYGTVRDYVAYRRPLIEAEAGSPVSSLPGFLLRHYEPGRDAEVDFGELWVRLDGVLTKCHLFVLRMSFSGKGVHRVYASPNQESFLDGHAHAFTVLGGLPTGVVRYDNLTSAVEKILFRGSRERIETARWAAFHSSVGFTPWYCEPGIRGAHEKGGVEGQVGFFRRNYLSPVPSVASLEELNALIEGFEKKEADRRIGVREHTIGQCFAIEAPLLRPLPDGDFGTRLLLTPTVDRFSTVMVRCNQYSVPARFIGRKVRVMLGAEDVTVFDRRVEVARHPRSFGKGEMLLVLDHYLEILLRKPGALAGSKALEQARIAGVFTDWHQRLWDAATAGLDDRQAGTRALIEVLLLHRHLTDADVAAGIRAALAVGAFGADIVALEARKHAQIDGRSPTVTTAGPSPALALQVSPSAGPAALRRIAELPADARPIPQLAAYDQLLHHTPGGIP